MSWIDVKGEPAKAAGAKADGPRKSGRDRADRDYWRQKALTDRLLEVEKLKARRLGLAVDEAPARSKGRRSEESDEEEAPRPPARSRSAPKAAKGPKKFKLDTILDCLLRKFVHGLSDDVKVLKPAKELWESDDYADIRKALGYVPITPAISFKTAPAYVAGHGVGYAVYFSNGTCLGRFKEPPLDGVVGFCKGAPQGVGLDSDNDVSDEDPCWLYASFGHSAPVVHKKVEPADLTQGFAWRQAPASLPLPNLAYLRDCTAAPGPPFRVVKYDSTKPDSAVTVTWVTPGPSWFIREVKDLFISKEVSTFKRVAGALHTNTIMPLMQHMDAAHRLSTCLSWYSASRLYSNLPSKVLPEVESPARVSRATAQDDDDDTA